MVSLTCHTYRRRTIRAKKAGRVKAKMRSKLGTPAFPIHPAGYDTAAADAKKS